MNAARFAAATSAWSVSLSPDGQRLAYVSDRNGAPQLFVSELDGSNETHVETGAHPVQEVHWSVAGAWLSVLVAPGGSPRTEVWAVRPDGRDLRRLSGTAEGASYLGPWTHRPGVLALAHTTQPTAGVAVLHDVATGIETLIAQGGQPLVLDVDREGLLALVRRGPRGQRTVWLVNLGTGTERELSPHENRGSTDLGRLSPDGNTAYLRSNAGRDLYALFAVSLASEAAGPGRVIAERSDAELEDLILTAAGDTAVLLWNRAGRSECELLDLETHHRRELLLPEPVAHGGSFSKDGRLLALTLEGPTHPRAVHVLDIASGGWRRITTQSSEWSPARSTPTLERLETSGGLELSGWLYPAATPRSGSPAAVLHLHGGPEAQERPGYNPLFQALAEQGITVFAPNVRGSSGFGRAFVEADNRELRFGAIADVAACAHFLFARELATPATLAVAGRSYGGYLTLAALVFHNDLFAAGVDICGMSDFATFYRDTEPWIAASAFTKYGHPEADAALLHELSPLHRFDALRAPLLLVHGENDSNVPLGEATQALAAAHARGIAAELLLFPGEGHELVQRANRERFLEHTVTWLVERLCSR
ncbi:MAG: prolyl oligopeptidase family serine peptidase [Polyangiaceae bacterium]